ncbi:tetratricopeptide repeat protein, partial [Fulvimarina sp. MAC3]|uniref:tetratricopeptide repeat protein n=1 Tax=Fulvimarina sp. MAC3 TaxID=3148887 RepID=UPI0031FC3585
AAEAGDAGAMANLGYCYDMGEGVEQDQAEAIAWYRKAAEAGDAVAMVNLGVSYARGEGVEQDQAEAIAWYRKAAEAGNAVAMVNLGVSYARGEGVEQDQAEAIAWYRKAAEAGHARAMANLGYCYARGEGVEQDQAEAIAWYRKAAEAGDEKASRILLTLPDREQLAYHHPNVRILCNDLDSDLNWPVKPLLPGKWRSETDAEAARFISEFLRYGSMTGHEGVRFRSLRSTSLSFYPGFRLVEALIEAESFETPKIALLLASKETSCPILGDSLVIHNLNATGALDLTSDDRVLAYLRFFCLAVCGEGGPFRIVEDYDPSLLSDRSYDPGAIRQSIKPFEITDRSLDQWTVQATVKYADALFATSFVVHANGMVEMQDDKPLLSDLPFNIEGFEGAFRIWNLGQNRAEEIDEDIRRARAKGPFFAD